MIYVQGSIATFEGTAKELTLEFTHCILGFKQSLIKEFNLSEEEVFAVIKQCGELAFMTVQERQQYLDMLLEKDVPE